MLENPPFHPSSWLGKLRPSKYSYDADSLHLILKEPFSSEKHEDFWNLMQKHEHQFAPIEMQVSNLVLKGAPNDIIRHMPTVYSDSTMSHENVRVVMTHARAKMDSIDDFTHVLPKGFRRTASGDIKRFMDEHPTHAVHLTGPEISAALGFKHYAPRITQVRNSTGYLAAGSVYDRVKQSQERLAKKTG